MSKGIYHLNSFRPWNPFQNEPPSLRKPIENIRYPSPEPITTLPPPSMSHGEVSETPGSHDKAQRHPLPARPPLEVCLSNELPSDPQSTRSEATDQQRIVPLEQLPRTPHPGNSIQILRVPDTIHIDPAILGDSCPSADHVADTTTDQDTALTDTRSSVDPSFLEADLVYLNPLPLSQCDTEDIAMLDQLAPEVTMPSYTRKKRKRDHTIKLPQKRTSGHKSPSFTSVQSHFLAMPVEEQLQFLSWLFERALSYCVSTPTSVNPAVTAHLGPSLDAEMMHDCAHENSEAESADAQPLSSQHTSISNPHHERLSHTEDRLGVVESDETEHEVEKILKHQENSLGSVLYLVKWKNYDVTEATWEPHDSMQDTAALENYERELAITMNKSRNSMRVFTSNPDHGTQTFCSANHSNAVTGSTKAHNHLPTRRGLKWSPEEKRFLTKLKLKKKVPWSNVCQQFRREFPGRTDGTIQLQWSKMKGNVLYQ
ncbi:uncharacterized protein N7484_008166 [Penicillium longicatenatum]|uniref:uncharacterized protein n=1 Tax=Penicillium longicatenatum TaxID=1561947 RepID=UPI002547A3A3|nr:uncharacterized protein N7484_008166 [Penicillium longicatenatum]KAJ5640304.1 hypothetical protein N7484_008166 [Penicillium longicatenatum]